MTLRLTHILLLLASLACLNVGAACGVKWDASEAAADLSAAPTSFSLYGLAEFESQDQELELTPLLPLRLQPFTASQCRQLLRYSDFCPAGAYARYAIRAPPPY